MPNEPSAGLPLEGLRALVGGASKGIGRGCAEALASQGAAVILMARRETELEQVRDALPTPANQTHTLLAVDFTDSHAVSTATADHLEATGPATILVNNTGGPAPGRAIDSDPATFAAGFAQHVVTFQGLVHCVLPAMTERGFGRIINIISTSVVIPIQQLGVSNTVRGAVANWGRTLASELGPGGITVNNVLPGYIDTDRLRISTEHRAAAAGTTPDEMLEKVRESVPLRRLGTPADIGAVVAFLSSPAAGYVNGVNLPVDGGRLVALNR